ncbi:MAG: valine--tRNA ligase [Candidatus Aenigmarchaeota archaeon]|nr:valine--tRNA ligase [Candidatus Aenigmarchaeota archaeon]
MVTPEPVLVEKSWSKDLEKQVYSEWKEKKSYAFDRNSPKPLFSIDTPPPYVNTPIHIGHATTYTMMDFFARFRRMTGHNVLFPLGLDRNGLPIEIAAEKKFGVSLRDVSREKFLEMCQQVLEASSEASIESFLRLGISFNAWNAGTEVGDAYYTDSVEYRALTQATFIDMWHRGLVYEDSRLNNYCPGCKTTLADEEVDHKEVPTQLSHVVLTVKETGGKAVIATTRPELLCTAAMVIFNPEDKRYASLDGKTAVIPIYDIEVPIQAHPFADPAFGTGLVFMSRSAGDQDAIRFLREMHIEPLSAITTEGAMNEVAGFLKGMKVEEARKKMIRHLRERGWLVKEEKVMHRIPICERSKHTIEYITMPEYYLKQVEFKDAIRKIANDIEFFSPHSRQFLLDWIDAVSIDWAISRRRYYATEMPLWYCISCGTVIVPPKGKYYRPWKEKPPVEKCRCGSTEFRGEERVFDTWFDSSISPLYILGYPKEFFTKHQQCTLRPQGKEIVRTWLYYTLLRCYHLAKKPIFRDVWIHHHIVDEHGKKMSKSLGNVINPAEILDKYGAEPFRFWCAVEGNLAEGDLRCSFERIEGAGKTLTKLWNVARFVSQFRMQPAAVRLTETDKWIMQEMNELITYARGRYEAYDFHMPATRLKHFIWETFASHYIELVKSRAYNHEGRFPKEEQNSAVFTLNYCLDTMLKLLAPVIPMMTHRIYNDLRGKNVHEEHFPSVKETFVPGFAADELMELNKEIWKTKKDGGLSLKTGISKLTVPEKFRKLEQDIVAAHAVQKILYGDALKIEL